MTALAVTVDEVQAALGTLATTAVLIGLLVKYALLPWLQTHLVAPVREVTRQVSYNGHRSEIPTLLDRVDTAAGLAVELRAQVDTVVATTADLTRGQGALGRMLDGHLDRSAGEWGRMWDAINELRAHLGLPPTERETDDE